MKLYRYWASAEQSVKDNKGVSLKIKKWGGSNQSLDEASTLAQQALEILVQKIQAIGIGKSKHYDYGHRDIPEEFLKEITACDGITRNRNGCLVLNSAHVMFVDIDLPFGSGFWAKLFGKSEEKYFAKLSQWLQKNPNAGVRIYRTAAGLRYLLTHGKINVDETAITWLRDMGADPLYIKLCKAQDCYRARLSPKPWRIGAERPPGRFPRQKTEDEDTFRIWLSGYESKSRNFAVCKFLKSVGNSVIAEDLKAVVEEHDHATFAMSNMQLA